MKRTEGGRNGYILLKCFFPAGIVRINRTAHITGQTPNAIFKRAEHPFYMGRFAGAVNTAVRKQLHLVDSFLRVVIIIQIKTPGLQTVVPITADNGIPTRAGYKRVKLRLAPTGLFYVQFFPTGGLHQAVHIGRAAPQYFIGFVPQLHAQIGHRLRRF